MYNTKFKVNSKADLGFLSIHTGGARNKGDPYAKPRGRNPSDDRFRGKQFGLPKRSGAIFSTFPFAVKGKTDPYNERISFLKLERRKGFGSSDPAKRDEFSHTITIEKYKEMIENEKKSAKKFAKRNAGKLQAQGMEPNEEEDNVDEEADSPEREEFFEYDQVFGLTPDDDTIGKAKTKDRLGRRIRRMNEENPLMRTTSKDYGTDCTKRLKKYSKHARTKSTEQLYDKGHLHIECH